MLLDNGRRRRNVGQVDLTYTVGLPVSSVNLTSLVNWSGRRSLLATKAVYIDIIIISSICSCPSYGSGVPRGGQVGQVPPGAKNED